MLPRVCVLVSIRVEVAQQYRCPINRYKLYTHRHTRTHTCLVHPYIKTSIYLSVCCFLFSFLTAIMQPALELRSRSSSLSLSLSPLLGLFFFSSFLLCFSSSLSTCCAAISGSRIAAVYPRVSSSASCLCLMQRGPLILPLMWQKTRQAM